MNRRASVLWPLATLVVVIACSDKPYVVGFDSTPPPALVAADAGRGAPDANDLITYCPSDRCPGGHTTCPSSTFLCDIDLLTDPNNCGECGNRCPNQGIGAEVYTCVEGRCRMNCRQNNSLDCDGLPDNGCETRLPNEDHCGVCGRKCPADQPCIDRSKNDWGCGCKPGQLFCPRPGPLGNFYACVDPQFDDNNCGGCRVACPREGDGGEPPPNTYYGCGDSACGVPKCVFGFGGGYGDCDGIPSNGCETSLNTNENCGACGNRCENGAVCRLNNLLLPECMCPQGVTFCKTGDFDALETGYCADLSASPENCGACGQPCLGGGERETETCIYGKCERRCLAGWGDCNGNFADGCETDLNADPKNCGACGRVCDGIAGQACVDGRCMVEPCDVLQDAGGPTR